MILFKKKLFSYLYIFFLILVFILFEFSTKFVFGKGYNVSNIQIEENYNLNFNKTKIIDNAFDKAFKILIYKILEKKDRKNLDNVSPDCYYNRCNDSGIFLRIDQNNNDDEKINNHYYGGES